MRSAEEDRRVVGRYLVCDEIASGGMATVHLGRLLGPVGFSRIVAIKQLYPHFAKDPEFVAMFVDEARLAARVRHPNVVPTLDVVSSDDELFLVMEYVHGEAFSRLWRKAHAGGIPIPPPIVAAILVGTLQGLHAAHAAKSERGEPLHLVHRDVSPQNILVGVDGAARVLDFGVAKAVGRLQSTHEGQTKGKLAYMSPEQARGLVVDRRSDVYSAAVVLWEALTGRRLFQGDDPQSLISQVLQRAVEPPSHYVSGVPAALDSVVMRGLSRPLRDRFSTALDMAGAIESAVHPASARELGEWVTSTADEHLRARASLVERIERGDAPEAASGVRAGAQRKWSVSMLATGEAAPIGVAPESHAKPEGSQVSSLSVSANNTSRRPRSSLRWAIPALACLVAVSAWALSLRPPKLGSFPPVATGSVTSPAPPVDPAATTSTVPSALAVLAVVPSAPPASVAPATSARPSILAPAHPTRPRTHPAGTSGSCDTPFTVDADGIRHARAECLHLTPATQ